MKSDFINSVLEEIAEYHLATSRKERMIELLDVIGYFSPPVVSYLGPQDLELNIASNIVKSWLATSKRLFRVSKIFGCPARYSGEIEEAYKLWSAKNAAKGREPISTLELHHAVRKIREAPLLGWTSGTSSIIDYPQLKEQKGGNYGVCSS